MCTVNEQYVGKVLGDYNVLCLYFSNLNDCNERNIIIIIIILCLDRNKLSGHWYVLFDGTELSKNIN